MVDSMIRTIPVDIEPKRKNRWIVEFPGDMGFAEWMVQASSRPSVSINPIEIPYMNVSTYVAGRSVWEPFDLTFIDCIGPSTTQKVMDWIRMCIEHASGRMGYAVNYKKDFSLKMLDPAGQEVEKWTIYGGFVTNANFGSLDMSDDSLADVTISIQYDRAVLNF